MLRSPGSPKLLIVSRALVARDCGPRERVQARPGPRRQAAADGVDARALGVNASALSKAQRIVWRDGPVVGELVVVGAAKDDGLVRRLQDIVRTRVRRTIGQSAVGRAAGPCRAARAPAPRRRSRPSRSRSPRCPACACPGARSGSIPDGTLATSWVLANYGRLTPGRR